MNPYQPPRPPPEPGAQPLRAEAPDPGMPPGPRWAPGPYPAGAVPFPAPPPPRRGRTTKIVLIVVGVVALLCCGGAVAGGFALYHGISQATGPIRTSVNTFLGHLEDGDSVAAYDGLCRQTRARFTQTQFSQILNARPRPTRHTLTGVSIANNNGAVSGTVSARIGYDDGSSDTHQFDLTKENGAWKVCGDPY